MDKNVVTTIKNVYGMVLPPDDPLPTLTQIKQTKEFQEANDKCKEVGFELGVYYEYSSAVEHVIIGVAQQHQTRIIGGVLKEFRIYNADINNSAALAALRHQLKDAVTWAKRKAEM